MEAESPFPSPSGWSRHVNLCETTVATKHEGFKDFVLDQFSGLPSLTCRTVFGGYGRYRRETFFGLIRRGRLYFKTDLTTAPRYRDRGMKPFKPTSAQTLKHYYEVPVEVLAASDDLTAWASQAAQRLQTTRAP